MGATLARLVVYDLNLTRVESIGWGTSIDLAVSDPLAKAEREFPAETQRRRAHWASDDHVVRVIYVPLVSTEVHVQGREGDKIDASHVAVMPRHKVYGGRSMGFGSDPELEQKLQDEPGFLIVNDVRYDLIDFKPSPTHVVTRYFNLDAMQTIGIDVPQNGETDPWPLTDACQDAHWDETDRIVRIQYELLSDSPIQGVSASLRRAAPDDCNVDKMEREVLTEPSASSFSVGDDLYKVSDFDVVKLHAS
jgi:hypothetical protein